MRSYSAEEGRASTELANVKAEGSEDSSSTNDAVIGRMSRRSLLGLLGMFSLGIIAIALAIALGVAQRKDTCAANQIRPSNTGVLAANGCRYSNAGVVAILSKFSEFTACTDTQDAYKTCFWDMSSKASNADLQKVVKLEMTVATAIKEGGVTTMEKVQLGLVARELRMWKKLVTTGHFFAATGDEAIGGFAYARYNDMTLAAANTAYNLMTLLTTAKPNAIAAPEDVVIGFLGNYSAALPLWHSMMLQAVAENKTHAHVIMVDEADNYRRGIQFNYSGLCPALSVSKSARCAQLASKIQAGSASYLQDWENVYLPACERNRPSSKPGLAHIPEGKEVYQAWVEYHVGFSKTARYIYDLGVKRVDDNRKAMVATMRLLAPEYTTFEAISNATTNINDPRWFFCGNDSTAAITYVHTLLAKINDVILDEFGALSAIRPTVIEEDGTAWASAGEYDLVRNFYTKNALYNIGRYHGCDKGNGPEAYFERLQLSTVLHEAFPGHGLQQSLANEVDCTFISLTNGVPTGFVEGWALYTETLGYKMGNDTKHPKGIYTDPFDEFSYFLNTMLRNNRLQADSGLHGDLDGLPNWSVDQSIKAMIDNGFNAEYAKQETNRYISWPGQAVAYMLGAQILLDLRAKTENDLGKEFNAPEFHNIILKFGGANLDQVVAIVETYIAHKKSPTAKANDEMFGIELVRDQFSRLNPLVGLGRSQSGASARRANHKLQDQPFNAGTRRLGPRGPSGRRGWDVPPAGMHPRNGRY